MMTQKYYETDDDRAEMEMTTYFFVFMENVKFIVFLLTIHAEMVSAIGHHPCCTNHHKNVRVEPEKNGPVFSSSQGEMYFFRCSKRQSKKFFFFSLLLSAETTN